MADKTDDLDLLGSARSQRANLNTNVTTNSTKIPIDAGEEKMGMQQEETPVETPAEKVDDEYEQYRKLNEFQRKRLQENLAEERKMTKQNKSKIIRKWREIMRNVKTEELKSQVDILANQMESEFDRYDHLIELTFQDVNHLEEQYLIAQRSHMRQIDEFTELHDETSKSLKSTFEEDLFNLKSEFNSERDHILEQSGINIQTIKTIYQEVEDIIKKRNEDQLQVHDTEREETRNKNLEDYNVVKITLEGRLEKTEKEFDEEHARYMELTEEKTREYEALKADDRRLAKEIDILMKKNNDLQSQVSRWKKKITGNGKECRERNHSLKSEKDAMYAHYHELKSEMTKFRQCESERLTELTTLAREAKKLNSQYLDQLAGILRLAEICRKYETEKEKVCTVYDLDRLNSMNEMELGDISRGDTMLFENFWKRYNKVLLDKMILDKERETLAEENSQLQELLKQYLAGVSVGKATVTEDNSLLIVNGRMNLKLQKPHQNCHVVLRDANHIMRNHSKQN